MVFKTKRLTVRRAEVGDAELICALWTDPQVMGYVGFPHGLDTNPDEVRVRIEEEKGTQSPFDILLVAELRSESSVIGQCIMHLPDEEGTAGTDIKLLPKHWRKGYGVEIKQGLLDCLFSYTSCESVQATPNVDNMASIKLQEAVGGIRIGEATYTFPDSMKEFTRPVHHYIYRVYRRNWEKH